MRGSTDTEEVDTEEADTEEADTEEAADMHTDQQKVLQLGRRTYACCRRLPRDLGSMSYQTGSLHREGS